MPAGVHPMVEVPTPNVCTVPWCDQPIVVWTLAVVDLDGVLAEATVPFCREHGPTVGGSV